MTLPRKPSVFAEAWLLRRLQQPALFDGLTTSTERRERLRAHLCERDMDLAIAGGRNGKCETWATLFQELYRQPLRP